VGSFFWILSDDRWLRQMAAQVKQPEEESDLEEEADQEPETAEFEMVDDAQGDDQERKETDDNAPAPANESVEQGEADQTDKDVGVQSDDQMPRGS
jgi:hypothetical protein